MEFVRLGRKIRLVASAAYEGIGEFNPGDWCKFCRAKARCRARSETMTALEAFDFKTPPLLTNDEVGEILVRAKNLKAWASDLESFALKSILSGKPIKGWKAVAGRSNRQFDDLDKAFEAVKKSGIDEAVLYERKPITLTAVETLLGKKKFEELLKIHVIKAPGAPTLAQESDSREEIINRMSVEEAFKEENGGN